MIRRIEKTNDLKDVIKSYPAGVIDDVHTLEYFIQGYDAHIRPAFTKEGSVLVCVLSSQDLKTLPNGVLYRRAYYSVEDATYPDGHYDLEIVDCMNIWLGEMEVVPAPPVPEEYLTPDDLKTINGESIVGIGDLTIKGELTPEQEAKIAEIDNKADKSDIENIPAEDIKMTYSSDLFDIDNVKSGIEQIAATTEYLSGIKADRSEIPGPFKTINGESVVGEGNIEIQGGGESYNGNIILGGTDETEPYMREQNKKVWDMLEAGTYRGGFLVQVGTGGTYSVSLLTNWFKAMGKYTFTAEYFNGSTQQMFYNSVSLWEDNASLSAYNSLTVQRQITAGTNISIDNKNKINCTIDTTVFATKEEIPDVSGFATKDEIPTIPENVSAFNNDAGYLTEHQSLDDCIKKSVVDGKWNLLVNTDGEIHPNEFYAPSTEGHGYDFVNLKTVRNFYDDCLKISEVNNGYNLTVNAAGQLKAKASFTPSSTNDNLNVASLGTVKNFYNDTIHKADIWTGTQAQWDALTDAQKASYTIALIRA